MFVRLPLTQTDNVCVVKFMFLFFLDIPAVSLAPTEYALVKNSQGNQEDGKDNDRSNQRRDVSKDWQLDGMGHCKHFEAHDNCR